MTNFVIKYHDLYFNKYNSSSGSAYVREVTRATKYAHLDQAKYEIDNEKLENHKVYQINFVDLVVK